MLLSLLGFASSQANFERLARVGPCYGVEVLQEPVFQLGKVRRVRDLVPSIDNRLIGGLPGRRRVPRKHVLPGRAVMDGPTQLNPKPVEVGPVRWLL